MDHPTVRRLRVFVFLATSRRPRTRGEISDYTGTSAKTSGRDCIDLISAGFPVVEEYDRAGRAVYRIDRDRPLPVGFACPACAAKGHGR